MTEIVVKKEVKTSRVLGFIRGLYRQYPRYATFSLILRVLTIVLGVLPALFYRDIINVLSEAWVASVEIAQHAIAILMYVLWLKLLNSIFYRLYDYLIIEFEMDIQEKLYNQIFAYLQGHSFQFFVDNFSGSLITKVRKCVGSMERFTDMLSWEVVPFLLNVALVVGIIAFQSVWLALWMLFFVVVFAVVQYFLYAWIYPYQEKANAMDSEFGGLLSDTISNSLTIKIFSSFIREQKNFAKLNADTIQARKTQYYKSMWIWWSSFLFAVFLEVGVMYFALRLRGQSSLNVGVIVLIQTYVLRIIDQLWGIGMTLRGFFRNLSEIGEAVEILDTPHAIINHSNKKLKIEKGRIDFQEVDFSYGEHQIFSSLSFKIKPGERVALVGESGSGKSTITKLLFRFYDIQKGQILIDGQDISQITQESLRAAISMVPQEPILFHRSIKENIAYGRPDASDKEIIAAAKMARCNAFIENFPEKYDTLVGERWVKLSGGERQRIAIARAILENSSILVMDEATSALDSESEALIQDAMEEVMQNKTVIVIAHRLSTVMKMDKIIVMEKGKIVEKGTHQELISNQEGIYHKLWNIQSGGFIA